MNTKQISINDQFKSLTLFTSTAMAFIRLYYIQGLDLPLSIVVCSIICLFIMFIFSLSETAWTKLIAPNLSDIIDYLLTQRKVSEPLKSLQLTDNESETVSNIVFQLREEEKIREVGAIQKKIDDEALLEKQYNYSMAYIGDYITEDEAETFKNNLREFAYNAEPNLQVVANRRLGNYKITDIGHLCHTIGFHTILPKDGIRIAKFMKASFPAICGNYDDLSLCKKISCAGDNENAIPFHRKHEPFDFEIEEKMEVI